MILLGLTGGIASGKSTVSNILSSQSWPLVDADLIAKQIVQPGEPALFRIQSQFGSDYMTSSGELNRPVLASLIFKEPDQRSKLNAITHPFIRLEMIRQILAYFLMGSRLVIVDVPLLLENGFHKWVHASILVYW